MSSWLGFSRVAVQQGVGNLPAEEEEELQQEVGQIVVVVHGIGEMLNQRRRQPKLEQHLFRKWLTCNSCWSSGWISSACVRRALFTFLVNVQLVVASATLQLSPKLLLPDRGTCTIKF